MLLIDSDYVSPSNEQKKDFVSETSTLIRLVNYPSEIIKITRNNASSGTLDTRTNYRGEDLLRQNDLRKNLLDIRPSYVDEHFTERQLTFLGETADVFKRYLGVFGSYNKRGKRVKRPSLPQKRHI